MKITFWSLKLGAQTDSGLLLGFRLKSALS